MYVTFSAGSDPAAGNSIVNPSFLLVDVGGGSYLSPYQLDWLDGKTWVGDVLEAPVIGGTWYVQAVPLYSPELGIELPVCQDPAYCPEDSGTLSSWG